MLKSLYENGISHSSSAASTELHRLLRQREEHTLLQGFIEYHGFERKLVLAAANPRTAAPELPGPMGHKALQASQGVGLGSRARSCAQECQGGSQPAWVSILRGKCGIAAAAGPQQWLPFSTLSILASEGVI